MKGIIFNCWCSYAQGLRRTTPGRRRHVFTLAKQVSLQTFHYNTCDTHIPKTGLAQSGKHPLTNQKELKWCDTVIHLD